MKQALIAITGPSCGGKSTLKNRIIRELSIPIVAIVSTTTRRPRAGEKNGKDYIFASNAEFDGLVSSERMIEWVEYDGFRYGIEERAVNATVLSGSHGVVVATPEGVEALDTWCGDHGIALITVLATEECNVLLERIQNRVGSEEKAVIRSRQATIRDEICEDRFCKGRYDLVVKRDHGNGLKQLEDVLLR